MTASYRYNEPSSMSENHGHFYEDPYIICPYDPAHTILKSRIQGHLVKCMRNNPHITKIACPFNATHRLDAAEMAFHMSECPSRGVMLNFKYSVGSSSFPGQKLVPVQTIEIGSEENWDDDVNSPSYDPKTRLKDGKLLIQLKGATPSERARFREERHAMYEKEVKSCSEESGIDPFVPPGHGSCKSESTIMAQASAANKNSTSGIESMTPDAETFYHRNKPLVDGSNTDSASFSADFSWMPKSNAKNEECVSSVHSYASRCNPIHPSPPKKWPSLYTDTTISASDVEQNMSASDKSTRTAAMSLCSESGSQASLTPRMAGRGDFKRIYRDFKPGFDTPQFESTRHKMTQGQSANFMSPNNRHQFYNFDDLKSALTTSEKSDCEYDPTRKGVAGRANNLTIRQPYVQPPPQPWVDENLTTDFWEPEASSTSSPPRRDKDTSGKVDYSLSGIGRGRRLNSLA